MAIAATIEDLLAGQTRRRVNRRLMPFLFLLFIVAYLDRVNVGFAGLEMTRDLGFSDAVFGFGGGVFFLGYFLLEVPGAMMVEVWSARKWIARIMITWGILASATAFIHTSSQFYWIRFFLGMAEAGFLPRNCRLHQPLVSPRRPRPRCRHVHGGHSLVSDDWSPVVGDSA